MTIGLGGFCMEIFENLGELFRRYFKFGFVGELSFAVGEGLAPPATQKIFFILNILYL